VKTCLIPCETFTVDWTWTVTVPFGTLVWNWLEVMLYWTPLILTQIFPADAMLNGTLIVRVGPTLSVKVAVLLARFVLFIVFSGSIVILNVWLPTVESQVNVEGAVAPGSTETCRFVYSWPSRSTSIGTLLAFSVPVLEICAVMVTVVLGNTTTGGSAEMPVMARSMYV